MAQPIRLPNAQEQVVLNQLVVRLITPEERPRWNELVSTHHYLKNARLVGEHLCYVAEYHGTWLGLLGWAISNGRLRFGGSPLALTAVASGVVWELLILLVFLLAPELPSPN